MAFFMKHIWLPRQTIVGKGILDRAAPIAAEFDRPLVICDQTTREIAGNEVSEALGCGQLIATDAVQAEQAALEKKADVLFAVGGGRIIDIAKIAATNAHISYVSVPTNCAHDGIASPVAAMKNGINTKLRSPWAILADIDIIRNAPDRFVAAGAGDIIAKYTAIRDWKLGHIIKGEYFGDYASSLAEMVSTVVFDNIQEIRKKTDEGLGILLEALISSGAAMAIAGSSRPASGSEHKFSHALDAIAPKPALHGEQVGIGTIIMAYLQGENWKKIKNALESAGCPTTAQQIGMDKALLLNALLKTRNIRPERYTIIEHIKLDEEIAKNALEATGVV